MACGTHSSYVQHRKRGEDCPACTSASTAYYRALRGTEPREAKNVSACQGCGDRITHGHFCSTKCFTEFVKPERPCAECGEMFTPASRGAQLYCSIPCRKRHGDDLGRERGKPWIVNQYANQGGWTPKRQAVYQLRRALLKGATAPGVLIVPADVFDRDGWICGLCAGVVDPELKYPDSMSVSLDHIIPVSLGGMHSMANVQCAHLFCNLSKNNRVEEVPHDPHDPPALAIML